MVPIVKKQTVDIPQDYQLSQNYPNPFNPMTTIEFDLPKSSEVSLKVYNILGEEVATLLSASLPSGSHKVDWNAAQLIAWRVGQGERRKGKGKRPPAGSLPANWRR
jgi:hypothetical protein